MKKLILLMTTLFFALLITSCGAKQEPQQQQQNTIVKGDSIEQEQVELTLYFPNKEYIETGQENLMMVLPEKREVYLDNRTMAKAAMEELLKGPKSPELSGLPERLKLIGVKVENGIAYVDFSSEGLSGGSLEESLVIRSVVMTLTEIQGINKVQFLVDGKIPETLMGHADVSTPISRM